MWPVTLGRQERGNCGGCWATVARIMHTKTPVLVRRVGVRAEGPCISNSVGSTGELLSRQVAGFRWGSGKPNLRWMEGSFIKGPSAGIKVQGLG